MKHVVKQRFMNHFFDKKTISVFWRYKFHFLIIILVSVLAAVVFSSPFFVRPKYESTTVAYPVNLSGYSQESFSEQMVQLLTAADVRNQAIEAFDLAEHYQIAPEEEHFRNILNETFKANVRVRETIYGSVEICVRDKNPELACALADSMISFYNQKVRSMHREKVQELLQVKQNAMQRTAARIDSIEAQMATIRQQEGILDYFVQTEEVTKGYFELLAQNQTQKANQAKDLLQALEKHGGEFLKLNYHLDLNRQLFHKLKSEYEAAYQEFHKTISYALIVSKPFVADKPVYPVRWLIVLLSFVGSFILASVVVSLLENFGKR